MPDLYAIGMLVSSRKCRLHIFFVNDVRFVYVCVLHRARCAHAQLGAFTAITPLGSLGDSVPLTQHPGHVSSMRETAASPPHTHTHLSRHQPLHIISSCISVSLHFRICRGKCRLRQIKGKQAASGNCLRHKTLKRCLQSLAGYQYYMLALISNFCFKRNMSAF